MEDKTNHKAGFSLIELMIAMVVAAIMFTGIYAVSIQSMNILKAARHETRAVNAAQYELEKIRSYSWSVIEAMAENTAFTAENNAVLGQLNTPIGTIKKTAYQPHQIVEPMYAVSVTVSWRDFRGDRDSKTVTSVITETGMIK